MRLLLNRRRDKSLLRGATYVLDVRIVLDDEDLTFVNTYKCQGVVLKEADESLKHNVTIGNLIDGVRYKCDSISDIVKREAMIRVATQSLKAHLEVIKSFDKEVVVEL